MLTFDNTNHLVATLDTKFFHHYIGLGKPRTRTVVLAPHEQHGWVNHFDDGAYTTPEAVSERYAQFKTTPPVGSVLGIGTWNFFYVFEWDGTRWVCLGDGNNDPEFV